MADWFTDWLTDWLINWLIDWMTDFEIIILIDIDQVIIKSYYWYWIA